MDKRKNKQEEKGEVIEKKKPEEQGRRQRESKSQSWILFRQLGLIRQTFLARALQLSPLER